MNILNHELEPSTAKEIYEKIGRSVSRNEDLHNFYKCKKCMKFINYYKTEDCYWTFNFNDEFHKWRWVELTCEEELIKEIIE
jgi:hypothetical protein